MPASESQAFEIDLACDDEEFNRIPRRCADWTEAARLAMQVAETYLPSVSESLAIKFRKVE